ncbi:polymer-forming cytoskeletal protein [Zestomonas carbonaria]|uniref:DUF342 domain-containing protein n=1 Tax=Zestomonas carbonaria TaxID=2762745 RepID=A0A7U7I9E5_9GAMM|nr:polymer-forming cytoskeletal protein [Pseudomonas carbonaria]CAD5108309.1 hypothetical protein PSEWESI4_02594 [Pseudomonas carbonaria]
MRSPFYQRGAATVLIVLITAFALAAIALSLIFSVRGNQDRQVAVHAATHSQAGAWSGVEVFRRYLESIAVDEHQLASLPKGKKLDVELGDNELTATVVNVLHPASDDQDKIYEITTDIRNRHEGARSATVVRATYSVSPGTRRSPDHDGVINLYDDLNLSGDIDIKGKDNSKINVDGSATLKGSVSGIESLRATKDIEISGSSRVGEVFANGTLKLSGSASVMKGSALGDITTSSGGHSGELSTNSNLRITNGSVDTGNALGLIEAGGDRHGYLVAGKTTTLNKGITGISNAIGDISIRSWLTVNEVNSKATVTCHSETWSGFGSIRAQAVNNCPRNSKVQAPKDVIFQLMTELQPFDMPQRPTVDAYKFKEAANYVFEFEGRKRRVTVKSVNGLADGVYYLGDYKRDHRGRKDYLCSSVDSNSRCIEPVEPDRTICQGHASEQGCITYKRNEWTLAGKNLAPGVMWFEGDLKIQNGRYYNTFVSTRSISTGGEVAVSSVNYSGYKIICAVQYPRNPTGDFADLYPSNLCDMEKGSLKNNAVGNIGLLAGGIVDGELQGGDIKLGSQSEISGSVIAGNLLSSSGDSTIRGYISAAGWGEDGKNEFGNDITLDLNDLPEGYAPGEVPGMGEECTSNCDAVATAKAKWVRYL